MFASLLVLLCNFAATPPALTTAVPTQVTTKGAIKLVGQLNVNTATEAELKKLPGLSYADFGQIVAARACGHIENLSALNLSPDLQRYLKTDGVSDSPRFRQLPLEILPTSHTASRK